MPIPQNFIRLINFCQQSDSGEIFLESIKIPMKKTPPAHRLICLFGNPMRALQRIRQKALKEKKRIYRVDIDVARGEIIQSSITLKNIGSTNLLPLDRVSADLKRALCDILIQDGDEFESEHPNIIIGQYPERLNLIWKDERFSHLSVIAWSAQIQSERPVYEKHAALKHLDLIVKKDIRNFSGEPESVRFLI